MKGLDRQQLLNAIVILVMALFVASGMPGARRWRRPLRLAAMIGFAVAAALALGATISWMTGERF